MKCKTIRQNFLFFVTHENFETINKFKDDENFNTKTIKWHNDMSSVYPQEKSNNK